MRLYHVIITRKTIGVFFLSCFIGGVGNLHVDRKYTCARGTNALLITRIQGDLHSPLWTRSDFPPTVGFWLFLLPSPSPHRTLYGILFFFFFNIRVDAILSSRSDSLRGCTYFSQGFDTQVRLNRPDIGKRYFIITILQKGISSIFENRILSKLSFFFFKNVHGIPFKNPSLAFSFFSSSSRALLPSTLFDASWVCLLQSPFYSRSDNVFLRVTVWISYENDFDRLTRTRYRVYSKFPQSS